MPRTVARDAMFVDRHPKFLDALNGIEQKFGIQFSSFPINRIER